MPRTAVADYPEPTLRDVLAVLREGFAEVTTEIHNLAEDSALFSRAARGGLRDLTTEIATVSATVGAQEVNLGQLARAHQATLALLNELYDAVRALSRDVAHLGRRLDVHAEDPSAHASGAGEIIRLAA
jgi:ABC-type transporter Mla subunit MlaD